MNRGAANQPAIFAFAIGLSSAAVLLFGARPALELSRPNLGAALRDWGMGSTGTVWSTTSQNRWVIAQMALSLLLLVGASLTTRSMLAVGDVDPGFDAEAVFNVVISVPGSATAEENDATMRRLFDELEASAAVEAVAWRSWVPAETVPTINTRGGGYVETRDGASSLPATRRPGAESR